MGKATDCHPVNNSRTGTLRSSDAFNKLELQDVTADRITRGSTVAAIFGFVIVGAAFLWGAVAGPSQPETCSVVPVNNGDGVNYDSNNGSYNLKQDTGEITTQLNDGREVRIIGGAACK